MPFAELDDVQIHYEWDGPEDAPVLVFCNSLGTTLRMWDPQIADFSKRFACCATIPAALAPPPLRRALTRLHS